MTLGPRTLLNDLTPIDRLMSEVEVGEDGKMRRTRRCKQFHDNIVAYNNNVSFASEGVDNVDCTIAPFTSRMQGNIYHQLPPLVPVETAFHADIYVSITTLTWIEQFWRTYVPHCVARTPTLRACRSVNRGFASNQLMLAFVRCKIRDDMIPGLTIG
jgi:hypothetical protein